MMTRPATILALLVLLVSRSHRQSMELFRIVTDFLGRIRVKEIVRQNSEEVLLGNHSRIVTDRGTHVCPILIEAPDARLGATLAEGLGPFALRHHACYTCYQHGSICSNSSAVKRDA